MCIDEAKTEGQVFTPTDIVMMILDSVRYTGKSVLTKTIIEPSFGKGAFLIEIVSRIIYEGRAEGKSENEIKEIIEKCVYGIEKDEDLYREAIQKLNELLMTYGIPLPSWSNLINGDTLLVYDNYIGKMDICIGNPPYVRIHNIEKQYRDVVKNFTFADGTTDLYIIFYEIGIQMLKEESGRLAYITPNSFLRNTSQKKFRNYLVNEGLLDAIYDFKDSKIFDADTYTCICVIDKNAERITKDVVEYREYNMYKMTLNNTIKYEYFRNQLQDSTWNLSSEEDILYLQQNAKRPIKIKSIATVQNGIAKDVVLNVNDGGKKIVYFNGHKVESTILHRCVKASKYDGEISNTYILYPYQSKSKNKLLKKSDGSEVATSYVAYNESEMQSKFPNAYAYLQEHWEYLETRDMDANADWFVFGRSQGLANSGYKKLVFKHVICKSSDTIEVHVVDDDIIVYSGIYITIDASAFIDTNGSKSTFNDLLYDKELEEVRGILASSDFQKYCVLDGKDMQGGYVSVSSVFVKNYGTMLTHFPNLPVDAPIEDSPIADADYMSGPSYQKQSRLRRH